MSTRIWLTALLIVPTIPTAAVSEGAAQPIDLERERPARPPYGGAAWDVAAGTALLAGRQLWLGHEGVPPVRILDRVLEVVPLGEGELAVLAREPSGEPALWITDGGPPRRLGPPGFVDQGRFEQPAIARASTGVILGKGRVDGEPGVWRLEEGSGSERLADGGWQDPSAPGPTTPPPCTEMAAAGPLFVFCQHHSDGSFELWSSDGTLAGTSPVVELPGPIELPRATDDAVLAMGGSYGSVMGSDGTAAGTAVLDSGVVAQPGQPRFLQPLGRDELAWLTDSAGGTRLVASDGHAAARVIAGSPSWFSLVGTSGSSAFVEGWAEDGNRLWRVDTDGTSTPLGTLGTPAPGSLYNLAPVDETGSAVFHQHLGGVELWFSDGTAAGTRRLAGPTRGFPWDGPLLSPLADGPLVPLLDEDPVARPMRVLGDGSLSPWEGLVLEGNGGSWPILVGELEGRALLLASTRAHGRTLWLSDGSAEGTRLAGNAIASACPLGGSWSPSLVGSDIVVDCIAVDNRIATWRWEGGELIHLATLTTTPGLPWSRPSRPPAAVRLAGALVVAVDSRLLSIDPASGAVTTLWNDSCPSGGVVRAGELAVAVRCGIDGAADRVWATDGTVLSRLPIDPLGGATVREVGSLALIWLGTTSWLSDGTPQGTRELGPDLDPLPTARGLSWTCAAKGDLLHRLDLADGTLTPLAMLPPNSTLGRLRDATPDAPVPLVFELWNGAATSLLWRCDGTVAGTGPVPSLLGAKPTAAGERRHPSLWRTTIDSHQLRQTFSRRDLVTGEVEILVDEPLASSDERRGEEWSQLGTPRLPVVAAGRVWVALSDEQHGREPWSAPLSPQIFADGFESGSTVTWTAPNQDIHR